LNAVSAASTAGRDGPKAMRPRPWFDRVGCRLHRNGSRQSWGREAEAAGARILTGGRREGAQLTPAVMADVTPEMKLVV